jgi:hypothetical protein
MVARRGVRKGVTGEGLAFNPANHNLITVCEFVTDPDTDRDNRGRYNGHGNADLQFRHIPIEGIEEIRIEGERYTVG